MGACMRYSSPEAAWFPPARPAYGLERAQLHKSMVAYGGTYMIAGDKVIHHIDIAWNNARLGSDQVRFFKLEGEKADPHD